MLVFDYRMVEGQPIHYYYPLEPPLACYRPSKAMEMREDLLMPPSPNSTQSDSDNSLSSIEVSAKPIRPRVIQHTKSGEIKCCWKSCGMLFESLDQLASHVTRVHASSGPGGLFFCGWEGCSRNSKGFNARYKMLVHVRTHTNEKPHRCCQCDKSFSRAENLKIHSRSHSGEKPYVCPVQGCGKAYSNSSDRFKHTRTHQVEKPYQCKVPGCPKRYTDPSSLRKHVKTYKHFVNEGQKVEEKVEQVQHSCDCTHMCCGGKEEFFRLIEVRRERCPTWDRYFGQERGTCEGQGGMEVDGPLDLSVRRRV